MEFLRLSIGEYSVLIDAMARENRRELTGPALVCSVYANLQRDKKKRSKAFTIDDFLPPDPDKQAPRKALDEGQSPEQMYNILKFMFGEKKSKP